MSYKILTVANAKIKKGRAKGYLTAGIHLAPAKLSGYQVCAMASAGCKAACLNLAGFGRYSNVQQSRIAKTKRFFEERESFMEDLIWDINALIRRATKNGLKPAVRLNLTSDVDFTLIKYQGKTIFEHFPKVCFYDYSKFPKRMFNDKRPANYHLTFSRSESNQEVAKLISAAGHNVAVVFAKEIPKTFWGKKVIDGTKTDVRFKDKKGVIVGLRALGKARKDKSGFVVR